MSRRSELQSVFLNLLAMGGASALGNLAGGGFRGGVVRTGAYVLGSLLASTLIKPPDPTAKDAGTLSGAQNQARPWGHVPRIYGKVRITPDLAATPVTDIDGKDMYLRLLLCCGHKPLRLSEFRFGDRSIGTPTTRNAPGRRAGSVRDIEMQISSGWGSQQDDLTLFNSRVVEQQLNQPLEYAATWTARGLGVREAGLTEGVLQLLSEDNAVRLGVDLLFPDGLMRDEGGAITGERVDMSVRYRPYGATTSEAWTYLVPEDVITAENAVVRTWTDGDIFGFIEDLNDTLAQLEIDLAAVSVGTRTLSSFFRSWLVASLDGNRILAQALIDDEDLTPAQEAQLTTFQGHLNTIETLLDTASDVAGDLADTVSDFNNLLSAAIWVFEFFDGIARLNRYIRQGVGPDLSTLTWFQQLLVRRRNATHLFGEAPTGSFIIANTDADPGQIWRSISWPVPAGKYEVQVRRVSESHSTRVERQRAWWSAASRAQEPVTVNTGIKDACVLWGFKSWLDEPAVSADAMSKYAFVAVRVKASEIWSGSVPRITCLAEAPIPYYSGGAWQPAALGTTYRNPAWIYAAILRGAENPSPATNAQIDHARLAEWATWCAERAYWFDYSFDQGESVARSLSTVAAAGRGSPTVRDGLYSAVYDHPQTAAAVVSLRNCYGFRSVKAFAELPHALRVSFRNEAEDYQEDEILVYREGYGPDGTDATLVETMSLPGVSALSHAEDLGKYMVRAAELRPESITFEMDWEYLTFERGDWISVQHDVVLWGLGSARITGGITLSGGKLASCTLDELVTLDATKKYKARLRTSDGQIHTGYINSTAGPTATMSWTSALDTGASTVQVGDLVVWGEAEIETIDCIIQEIRPRNDLRASVRCCQASPLVYDLDAPVVYHPGISTPVRPGLARPEPPMVLAVKTDEAVLYRDPQGNVQARIVLDIVQLLGRVSGSQRAASLVDAIELQYRLIGHMVVTNGRPQIQRIISRRADAEYGWRSMPLFRPSDTIYYGPAVTGQVYDIRVRSITSVGVPSEWTTLLHIEVVGKSTPPPDVRAASYLDGVLSWAYDDAPLDHAGFQVRVLHGAGGSWDYALPAHEGVLRQNSFRVPPGEGGSRVYFVKAIDTLGLLSRRAATVTLDLGDQPVEAAQERYSHSAHSWPGTKVSLTASGSDLQQNPGTRVGFYRGRFGLYLGADKPLYHTDYLGASYYFDHVVNGDNLPYRLGIEVSCTPNGNEWVIEYRSDEYQFWPDDLQNDLWPTVLSAPVWPSNFGALLPVVGRIQAVEDATYRFRLHIPANNNQFVLHDVVEIRDRALVSEYVNSFSVAASGTVRLPLAKTYTAILSVTLTLEYSAGTASAVTAKVLDRDEDLGPSVAVYDTDGNRVAGIVDALIQGY